jgi:hypothetical protein
MAEAQATDFPGNDRAAAIALAQGGRRLRQLRRDPLVTVGKKA